MFYQVPNGFYSMLYWGRLRGNSGFFDPTSLTSGEGGAKLYYFQHGFAFSIDLVCFGTMVLREVTIYIAVFILEKLEMRAVRREGEAGGRYPP